VSAVAGGRGLRPRLTSGTLVRWELAEEHGFPDGYRGRCGVRIDVDVLATPPIL
jgi:hypothetical protein